MTDPDQMGRWRCWLCPWPRWVRGTWAESVQHWQDEHANERG